MPFLKVDFSGFHTNESLRKELQSTLAILNSPFRITSQLFCLGKPSSKPKGDWKKFVATAQWAWLICISCLILLGFVVTVVKGGGLITALYSIGIIDFFFILYWNYSQRRSVFFKLLMRSSIGVGILKYSKKLQTVKNVSVCLSLAVVLLPVVLISLDLLQIINIFPNTKINTHVTLRTIFAILVLLVLVMVPAANALAFTHLATIVAEFQTFNDDFVSDVNTNQLAVTRHYIHAHSLLLRMFHGVRFPLSLWCSVHLLLNSIIVYHVLVYLFKFNFHEIDHIAHALIPGLLSLFLVVCLFQSISILSISIRIKHSIGQLRHLMGRILYGEKAPHEETCMVVVAFTSQPKTPGQGVTFFGATIIDRQFINAVIVASLVLIFYLYKSYYW